MRQHSIDLLPSSIRARSEAGLRAGRFIAAAVAALALLLLMAMHSLIMLIGSQESLFACSTQAEQVFATEARALELKAVHKKLNAFIELYERTALPMDLSAVMSTVINSLPESITLDQIDLDAAARAASRTPRAKGTDAKNELPRRMLHGELSGFGSNDQEIAELVNRLAATPPFRDVNLDFSRNKVVHGRDAREFRLSFRIDLDGAYQVAYRTTNDVGNAAARPE